MYGYGVLDGVEFDDHGPLELPGFVSLDGVTPSQHPATGTLDRGNGELAVGRQFGGVLDLPIANYPVGFRHVAPSLKRFLGRGGDCSAIRRAAAAAGRE